MHPGIILKVITTPPNMRHFASFEEAEGVAGTGTGTHVVSFWAWFETWTTEKLKKFSDFGCLDVFL